MSTPQDLDNDAREPGRDAPAPGGRFRSEYMILVAITVFGLWVLYVTTTFHRPPPILSPGLLPHVFPQLLVYVLFGLAALIALQASRHPPVRRPPIPWIVPGSAGLVVGFVLLAQIDLFIAFIAFFLGLSWLWGERRVVPMVIVAVSLPLAIFLLFDQVLEVRFPRGLLTNIYYDW
jgi:putative tricarboxylic transport membrane protein